MPKAFAVSRCPNSCSAMDTAMPNANSSTPRMLTKVFTRRSVPSNQLAGTCACPVLGGEDLRDVRGVAPPVVRLAENLADGVHDRQERRLARDETRQSLLVRGVVDRGQASARGSRLPCQLDRRERDVVQRL